jgi:hypothetical protein
MVHVYSTAYREMPCALRAPTLFLVRIETIRTKNRVMNKSKGGLEWLLSEIVDCARMKNASVRNRRSARTAFRPRNI